MSYTFDLQSVSSGGDVATSSSSNSFTLQDGDMAVTFSGAYVSSPTYTGNTLTGGTVGTAYRLNRYSGGAGVYNTTGDGQHTVDGKGYQDWINMAFSYQGSTVNVTLTALGFGYIATGYSHVNSSFEILLDSNNSSSIALGDNRVYSGNATSNVDLSGVSGLVDDLFAVKAGYKGSWKLKTVTVEFEPTFSPPVPLPATGLLLVGALGGLAAVRRRKS